MDSLFKILPSHSNRDTRDINFWRSFFEELGSSAWAWNLSNDRVEFTSHWLKSIGYSAGDISSGTEWFSLLHPDDAEIVSEESKRCIDGVSERLNIDFRIRKKNGGYCWVNSRAKIIATDDEEQTQYFFGLYTDITQQQESKKTLGAHEFRWNKALEGSKVGVWDWDIRTGDLYWSPEFYRILKLEEPTTTPSLEYWYKVVVPEDRERNRTKLESYLAGKIDHYRDEHQINCADGSRIWILTRATVTARSDSGEPLRMIGTLEDISARKSQERALKLSHERIHQVTATIPGFVYEYHVRSDGSDYFPYASDGIQAIYDVNPKDVIANADIVRKAIHPEDLDAVAQSIEASVQTGRPWQLQYRLRRTDGEIRTVKGMANRLPSLQDNGTAVFFGYIYDVTEEVKMARRGEDIAQLVPGALFQYTTWPDGRHCFPYFTKGMGSFFGVPDVSLAENGDIVMQAVHQDDVKALSGEVRKCEQQRIGWELEYRVLVDGKIRWHRATTNIVEEISPDGSTTWNGYLNDITDAKAHELKIAEQHQLIQKVTTTIPGVIYQYVIAPDNSISIPFLSDGVFEIFGVTREATLSRPESLWTYIHPDDRPRLQRAVDDGQDFSLEYRVLLPTIGEQWRLALTTCEADQDGTKTYYAYVMDATSRKEDELKLHRQSEAVALANSDLEQFNYVAAHDLKEPLRAIKHLSEWIEEDLADIQHDAVSDNLKRMRMRVERLQLLVDDLAAYSRAGRQGDDTSLVNLSDLLHNIVADLDHLNCHVDLSRVENTDISTVRIALETVFKNLIHNAIQHTDAQSSGNVIVTAEKDDYFITCSVEDDGPGIAPEHHERVFKMYQRLNPEKNSSGSGSGLTIVRRILGAVHGTILLESPISVDGRGTRFVFRWPVNWPKNPL